MPLRSSAPIPAVNQDLSYPGELQLLDAVSGLALCGWRVDHATH